MSTNPSADLAFYEASRAAVEPFLRTFRLTNTALDALFYDVGVLYRDLFAHGLLVGQGAAVDATAAASTESTFGHALQRLDLSALSNPEGAILIVDAARAPYIRPPHHSVADFLAHVGGVDTGGEPLVQTITLTGVGSSALGSAAFAWNVSTALKTPVAAIVPGFGLADVVHQALGGWFGFGLHDWIRQQTQTYLASAAPHLATVGRNLTLTAPGHAVDPLTAAPVFRQGSVGSDTLHAILRNAPAITRVVGHSKGALAIANAIRSLPAEVVGSLTVVTFGCSIDEGPPTAGYEQYLGRIDGLGILNSWGHRPDTWLFAHHSTNSFIPLSMHAADLLQAQVPSSNHGTRTPT